MKTFAGRREIPLDPDHMAMLTLHKEQQAERAEKKGVALIEDPFVLSFWPDGHAPYPNSLGVAFSRLATKIGLPDETHAHQLRHSAATALLASMKVDIASVAKMLGHRIP